MTETPDGQAAENSETARLNDWFDEKYEEQLLLSPLGLTQLGRKEKYGEVDDFSQEAAEDRLEWRRESVREMEEKFDYDLLTDEAKISYTGNKYFEEVSMGKYAPDVGMGLSSASNIEGVEVLGNYHDYKFQLGYFDGLFAAVTSPLLLNLPVTFYTMQDVEIGFASVSAMSTGAALSARIALIINNNE